MSTDSSNTVRWGVLSTAKIGIEKVIPAMQKGKHCRIGAISSRNREKARSQAAELNIPRAYGSYEELLADPDIDAVYNPLPNHLHVEWSIRALEAGKHVLCEKPIGLSSAEGEKLLQAARAHPRMKIMEAFMYRHHPQWKRTLQIIEQGGIGELKTIQSFFSYFNNDPDNIRNRADIGGGGLMDIGCYNISLSRLLFDAEPISVLGLIEDDPVFGTDRLASGILRFEHGTSTFTCSTQISPYQHVNALGTRGRVEIEVPFNAPADRPGRLWHQDAEELREIKTDPCDQYTIQGDRFARSILDDTPVPTPLEDGVNNMHVIEAVRQSAEEGRWIDL